MRKEEYTLPEGLNDGQRAALKSMIDFVHGSQPERTMFLLEGYAGTGKTFLVSRLIEYVLKTFKYWQIAITAPTNKAVKVLSKSSIVKNERLQFSTIHSLLGLKEEITEDGLQVFTNDKMSELSIHSYTLIIVDEVSMLNDELFLELQKHNKNIFMIFMGDPAQIPPVNKTDCIPFLIQEREKYKFEVALLSEIMRQKNGNPIIEAGFHIRQNLALPDIEVAQYDLLNNEGQGIVRINSGDEEQRQAFLKILDSFFNSQAFKDNTDFAKVIAWRNKTVGQMNQVIREMIFGKELNKIMIGEKLLSNKPILEVIPNIGKIILFTTNEEFEVVEYNIETSKRGINYYKTKVAYSDLSGKILTKHINIIHEDSEKMFNTHLLVLKSAAFAAESPQMRKACWKNYYDFLRLYADVGYNYAITAHKSQGSTYSNVFILEDDINQNKNIIERNRIKYTACTRPTDKLFIIKR